MKNWLLIPLLMGSFLGGTCAAGAVTGYRIEVIAWPGEPGTREAGGVSTWIGSRLSPGTLNDRGQILFASEWGNGNQELFLAADGEILPVVALGGEAPGGQWRGLLRVAQPGSMNQQGSAALAVGQPLLPDPQQGQGPERAEARQVRGHEAGEQPGGRIGPPSARRM